MARSRSYRARGGASQGPALPGLEDSIFPARRSSTPRPSTAPGPVALPARLVLELARLGRLELVGLLALVLVRGGGAGWRASQAEVARGLGVALSSARRHERELERLGLLELERSRAGRRLRVVHRVLHNLPTAPTGERLDRSPVSGSRKDNGSCAREDPGTGTVVPSHLHVRAGARAPVPCSPALERELDRLALAVELWPNVRPQLSDVAGALELAWGSDALARYLGRLEAHLLAFDFDRRAGLLVGSLRARARRLSRGPRRAS